MLKLIQSPTHEPISLQEAKDALRILHNDDDDLIQELIIASRQRAEDITNRQIMPAVYELYSEQWITKLPKNPILRIGEIAYLNENNEYQYLESTHYYWHEEHGVGSIEYIQLPVLQSHKKAFRVTFECGYETVPVSIKRWLCAKVAELYDQEKPNINIDQLLQSYRIIPS